MEVAARAAAPPLEVDGVGAAYGKKRVLERISFTLRPGEVFGLVGLNGAGKTTLIRSILGLRGAEGSIKLFGESNARASARRRLIYLPERFQPAPQLSGFEHLAIVLDFFDQKLDRDRARDAAKGLDLDPLALDRRVRTYSKGMGQKLGLVGSLLVDAPLMVLDEPTSGLDPRARVVLKDRLIEQRAAGRTIFFSSHILSDIDEICDRLAVIHNGKLIFLGRPSEFATQYGGITLERAFLAAIDQTDRGAESTQR